MKELTIEQKSRRYDEALEVAQRFYNNSAAITKKGLEDIFSELKESDDERIRKSIIKALRSHSNSVNSLSSDGFKMEDAIAWLEKQGEQKPADSIKEYDFHGMKFIPKFKKGDLIREILSGRILTIKDFSYDNGLYTYDTGQFPITIQDNYEIIEQKPADLKTKAGNWYVCDMEVMNENMVTVFHRGEIYYCPKDGYLDVRGALFEVGCLDVFRLATEKEIPQTKQEWSEEDKSLCSQIQGILSVCKSEDLLSSDLHKEMCERLKSLKDRYTWKPSIAQLNALSIVSKGNAPDDIEAIVSLYNDLKNL